MLAFRWTGAALAAAIMGFPLMVRGIRLAIEQVDPAIEDAARSLGAAPMWTAVTVTLPLALPGVLSGMVLAFAKALGEFGATITFVSNIPDETRTLALAIYSLLQTPGTDAEIWRLTWLSIGDLVCRTPRVRRPRAAHRTAATMTLTAEIRHPLDRFDLDVRLALDGGLTALLGPSGAGKTRTLDSIAGLLQPERARVVLDEDVLADTAANIWVPPHRRHIGYVFQDARLFPHLTVRQNLVFGAWFNRRRGRADSSAGLVIDFADVVSLLDLAPILTRRPSRLSGGERRRVALGRALLSHPRLLLLDEPLGSLDVARRQEILPYLDRLIAELRLPMIYVTHDWEEIAGRANRVVRMDQGKIVSVRRTRAASSARL